MAYPLTEKATRKQTARDERYDQTNERSPPPPWRNRGFPDPVALALSVINKKEGVSSSSGTQYSARKRRSRNSAVETAARWKK